MTDTEKKNPEDKDDETSASDVVADAPPKVKPHPDPTRYGDWEIKGKCVDF